MLVTAQKALQWSEQGCLTDRVSYDLVFSACLQNVLSRSSTITVNRWQTQFFIQNMKDAPIALAPDKANDQHYEVPATFFDFVPKHNVVRSCLLLYQPF